MTIDEWLVVLGFSFCLLGYVIAFACGPLRNCFLDGFRCMKCHPELYWVPGILGSGYTAFALAREVQRRVLLAGEELSVAPDSAWAWITPDWQALALSAWMPMLERLSGTFHVAVTPGPLGALGALLFLLNWKNSNAAMCRGLLRCFPRAGWLVYGLLVLCALAALVRLVIFFAVEFFGSKEDARPWLLRAGFIDALGWMFEYFLGAFVQVALLLLALAWVRGVALGQANLVVFVARRFCFVMPWLMLIVVIGAASTQGPVLATGYHPARLASVLPVLPWVAAGLHAFLILFPTMQINMMSEFQPLRRAFSKNARFVSAHMGRFCWFLLLSGTLFYAFAVGDSGLRSGLGDWTLAGVAWVLLAPWLWALPVGWVLSSWVCFYHACEAGRLDRSVAY